METPEQRDLADDLRKERSGTQNYRREADKIVSRLVADVAVLKSQMAENTAVTKEVRDILGSFKVVGKLSKWLFAIGASAASVYYAIKGGAGIGNP